MNNALRIFGKLQGKWNVQTVENQLNISRFLFSTILNNIKKQGHNSMDSRNA